MKVTQKVKFYYKGLNPHFPKAPRGLLTVAMKK